MGSTHTGGGEQQAKDQKGKVDEEQGARKRAPQRRGASKLLSPRGPRGSGLGGGAGICPSASWSKALQLGATTRKGVPFLVEEGRLGGAL